MPDTTTLARKSSIMSKETLNAFIAKIQSDSALMEQMKAATDIAGGIAIAKNAGFDLTQADFLRLKAKATAELSDEQLEEISGGAWYSISIGTIAVLVAQIPFLFTDE